MRGIELLLDPINDRVRGIELLTLENLIIEVRDFDTNNIVPNAQVTITGNASINGVYNNAGELNLYATTLSAVTTIQATASGYTTDSQIITHEGDGSYYTVTLIIQSTQIDFDCEIITENEGGNSLNQNLSETENTVVKAVFSTIDLSTPDPLLYKGIIRQWNSTGTTDENVVEYSDLDVEVSGNSLIYSLVLTPDQVTSIGDRITIRIINL